MAHKAATNHIPDIFYTNEPLLFSPNPEETYLFLHLQTKGEAGRIIIAFGIFHGKIYQFRF